MNEQFRCPLCHADDWQTVEQFGYRKGEPTSALAPARIMLWRGLRAIARIFLLARPSRRVSSSPPASAYEARRRAVLFDVWFPDSDEVTLTTRYCQACGFMTYAPRPTNDDIAAKYGYLYAGSGQTAQKPAAPSSRAVEFDAIRARRIHATCTAQVGGRRLRVLDYGGSTGRLMKPFLDDGHECCLVDYDSSPIDGVTKLADDISGLPDEGLFDVIICSHVLEHVSEIAELVRALRERLTPDGILYAEVPQEIWAGVPLEAEPVTHINYFTRNSFANLFRVNGFDVVKSAQQVSVYEQWHLEVVWVVAKPGVGPRHPGGSVDIESLLHPSRIYSARKMFDMVVAPKVGDLLGHR